MRRGLEAAGWWRISPGTSAIVPFAASWKNASPYPTSALFPDSIAGHALEAGLADLAPRLGGPVFLGAAASGGDHAGAPAWAGDARAPGGTVGLIVQRPANGKHRVTQRFGG